MQLTINNDNASAATTAQFCVTDFKGNFSDFMERDEAIDCAREWDSLGFGPCVINTEAGGADIRRDGRDDEGMI